MQEDQQHQTRQQDGEAQFILDVCHAAADVRRSVELRVEVGPRRELALQFWQRLFDGFGDGDSVRTGLLEDKDADRSGAVGALDLLHLLVGVDDGCHIADADPAVGRNWNRLKVSDGLCLAAEADGPVLVALDEVAGRHVEVVAIERLHHLQNAQAVRLQLALVDLDLNLAHEPANDGHPRHAGDRFQLFLERVFGDLLELRERLVTTQGQAHNGRRFRVVFGDDRRLGVGWQVSPNGVDAALYVLVARLAGLLGEQDRYG